MTPMRQAVILDLDDLRDLRNGQSLTLAFGDQHLTLVFDPSEARRAHGARPISGGNGADVPGAARPHKCKRCGYTFASGRALKIHRRIHDPKQRKAVLAAAANARAARQEKNRK